ncbi:transglycosylase domain-containing protein [Desmospora activa]|uniref:Penicillin-binding protein n=1 Tax=Desmospora activa DSM 45169 TaxID=1121389 RepID=A0A2T4ZDI0_9BACL|nr:transglycosylase domain-containing protein [Desmospora activa]PTM59953.1 penicillin-binding protein [Desmospora activa DSM 45169]
MKRKKRNLTRYPWLRWITVLSLFVIVFLLAGTGTVVGYLFSTVERSGLDRAELQHRLDSWNQTSFAHFRDGTSIGAMRSEADRKWVHMHEVSPYLIQALVATEDKDFYRHPGLSPRGLARAAWDNIKNHSFASGGSTITQQLVKNAILKNREKALERKLKEMWLALKLERMLSKDQILAYYLNSLFFGKGANHHNLLGVQAAARGIFGVDASKLNLAQSAYLAGMIQRPNAFNPFEPASLAAGQKRMRTVIRRMVQNGMIDQAAAEEALSYDLSTSLAKPKNSSAYRRHPFVMAAIEERAAQALMKAEGLDAQELSRQGMYRSTLEQYRKRILTGGYHIVTTLDPNLHEAINRAALNPHLYAKPVSYTVRTDRGPKRIKHAQEEVGATLINPQNGAVLAFVGGRDFKREQTNHALHSRRQPGSTIKPLLDYGTALEKGIADPATVLIDEPLESQGQDKNKIYKNQTEQYRGPVTLREALRQSLNIPAIKTLRKVGIQEGFNTLRKMDFPIHRFDGEASAIGGFTRGFTVEEMTAGYATLATDGIYHPPHLIELIEDAEGRTVYQQKPEERRIFSPQTARWMTDLLQDVMNRGTGRLVGSHFPHLDIAGKTGTTQENHDVWFIGYTPRLSLGVWVGYDWNHPLPDDKRAKRVWREVFQAAQTARPELFSAEVHFVGLPDSWEQVKLCKVSGQLASPACEQAGETVEERLPVERIPEHTCPLHQTATTVTVQGKRYLAHPTTPDDFTEEITGIQIPPDEEQTYQYYNGEVLPQETDPRLSTGTPLPPVVSAYPDHNGITLTWSPSPSSGVAGYRIYRDGIRIASIPVDQSNRYTDSPGFYSITSVAVDGLESEAVTASIGAAPTHPRTEKMKRPQKKWQWW